MYGRLWTYLYFAKQPTFYIRHIDDIFGRCTGTETNLKNVKKNPEMIDLRFKKLSTEFLDVIISLEKEFLSSGLDKYTRWQICTYNRNPATPNLQKTPFSSDLLSECTPNVLIQSTFKHPEKKIKTNLLKRGYSNKEVTDQLMMVGKLNCCILMFYRENPTNATVFRFCWTVLEDCQIFTIQIKMVKKNFFDCNSSNFIKCDKATYTFEDRGWCIKYMFKLNITD